MKRLLLIILILDLVISCSNRTVNSQSINQDLRLGINPNDELLEKTFFGNMTLLVPKSFKKAGDTIAGNMFNIMYYINSDTSIDFTIRKKEFTDLETIKATHVSMAKKFYNGEIHKSEFVTINNLTVYVFEMSGYWNGSKIKESWLKFFTNYENNLYQCLFKYPEKDRISSEQLRLKIIKSLRIK